LTKKKKSKFEKKKYTEDTITLNDRVREREGGVIRLSESRDPDGKGGESRLG